MPSECEHRQRGEAGALGELVKGEFEIAHGILHYRFAIFSMMGDWWRAGPETFEGCCGQQCPRRFGVTGRMKTSRLWAIQNQPLRGENFLSPIRFCSRGKLDFVLAACFDMGDGGFSWFFGNPVY